jgi:ribosomal 30S subunit maturation factor RimM
MILYKNIHLRRTVCASVNKQQVMVNKKHFQANDLLINTQNLREIFEMERYHKFQFLISELIWLTIFYGKFTLMPIL